MKSLTISGSRILYDEDDLSIIPFRTADGGTSILIRRDGDGFGTLLSSFTTKYKTEGNIASSHFTPYPAPATELDYDRHEVRIFIARVDSNETDTIRAIYSGVADPLPSLIVGLKEGSSAEDCYNQLDPGNTVEIHYGTWGVKGVYNRETTLGLYCQYSTKYAAAATLYAQKLAEYKDKYIQEFAAGKVEVAFVAIFRCTGGDTLSYTDTTIRIPDKDNLLSAMTTLARDTTTEFEPLLRTAAWIGKEIFVNGVRVAVEVRHSSSGGATLNYVNGKRIAAADVNEVITHVTCFRDQAAYNDYVATVSKISLKYHRAVTNGVETVCRGINSAEATTPLPNDYSFDAVTTAKLQLRKVSVGTRAEVFLCGKWRKINNFDMFTTVAAHREHRRYPQAIPPDGIEKLSNSRHRALAHLSRLDNFLVAEDWVFPQRMYGSAKGSTRFHHGVLRPDAMAAVTTLLDDFIQTFAASIGTQQAAIIRSKAMLDRVVAQEKVQVKLIHDKYGTQIKDVHYLVTGKSGQKYMISQKTGAVTNVDSNAHICIVNAGGNTLGGYDYVTSLIHALANDNRSARQVTTLPEEAKKAAKVAP
jgi:hypothetical protein